MAGQLRIGFDQIRIFGRKLFPAPPLGHLFQPFAAKLVDHRRIFHTREKFAYRRAVRLVPAQAQAVIGDVRFQRGIQQARREFFQFGRLADGKRGARGHEILRHIGPCQRRNQEQQKRQGAHRKIQPKVR